MKFSIALISILFISLQPAFGTETDRQIKEAKQAYSKKNFYKSIDIYNNAIQSEKNNPSLYFNLGLSYKADKQFAKAIWAFEKTLKLKPNDNEAIQLINACYLELDSSSTWSSNEGTFMRKLFAFGSNFWSLSAIIYSVLCALFIIRMRQMKNVSRKKLHLSLAVFSGVLLLFSVYVASASSEFEKSHDYAIVVEAKVPTYKEASLKNDDTTSFVLQPGSKVEIVKWNKSGRSAIKTLEGKQVYVGSGVARI